MRLSGKERPGVERRQRDGRAVVCGRRDLRREHAADAEREQERIECDGEAVAVPHTTDEDATQFPQVDERLQIIRDERDIRSFSRYGAPAAHRDAHVCRGKRRRIKKVPLALALKIQE